MKSEKSPLLRCYRCYLSGIDDREWGRARRGPNICTKRHFRIAAWVIYPAGATMHAEKIPTTAEKLGWVPRWQRGPGELPGRLGHPAGKNAHELETLEPSAASGPWPVIFVRLYFSVQAARRSVVAI